MGNVSVLTRHYGSQTSEASVDASDKDYWIVIFQLKKIFYIWKNFP